jgi:tetratricopeptide (TPR) repeat protein
MSPPTPPPPASVTNLESVADVGDLEDDTSDVEAIVDEALDNISRPPPTETFLGQAPVKPASSKPRPLAPSDALIVQDALSAAADGALDAATEELAPISADTSDIVVEMEPSAQPSGQEVTQRLQATVAREPIAEPPAEEDEDLDNAPTATRLPGQRQSFASIPPAASALEESSSALAPPPTNARTPPEVRSPTVPPPGPRPQIARKRPSGNPPTSPEIRRPEPPDPDVERLRGEQDWEGLVELYLSRMEKARSNKEKARLLKKIGVVFRDEIGDAEQALDGFMEAYKLDPSDDEIRQAIAPLARALNRKEPTLPPPLPGAVPKGAERPGASLPEKDRLERALDAAKPGDDKLKAHIALARFFDSRKNEAEALKHYEAAIAIDAEHLEALAGIERIARAQEKFTQVVWALERQVEASVSTAKITFLLKLGELHEKHFVKPQQAAPYFEQILQIKPGHADALAALERCYHAMRAWPELVRAMTARADATHDKKSKIEILSLAAEVIEGKLGDLEGAMSALKRVYAIDDSNKRALTELARIAEKLQDWGAVATFKGRLAAVSGDPRAAAQTHFQIGELLNRPDRDPVTARLHYEKAVTADPAFLPAWEALQKLAEESGDPNKLAVCLEKRAAATEAPRIKAQLFVDLAKVRASMGQDRQANTAYESALAIDPTNEVAGSAMLQVYVRAERWNDAGPVCEMLINNALRDGRADRSFELLRLATRIAREQGNLERALAAALAAFEARPDDPNAREELLEACHATRDKPVIVKAKAALDLVRASAGRLDIDALSKLADIERALGDGPAAMDLYERCLEKDPGHRGALVGLAEAALHAQDWNQAATFKVRLARLLDGQERFDKLVEAGEIWARRAGDLATAAKAYEEARQIKPRDHWLLHTLMWVYGESESWESLVDVLRAVVDIQETDDRRAKSVFAMAQVLEDKIRDHARAAQAYEEVLDLDVSRLDAFEKIVRIWTEAKDWTALERAYRKMLARNKDTDNRALQKALFHQLGLIYRDRMARAEPAIEAFQAAAKMDPDDADIRRGLTELLVIVNNLDEAVARLRERLKRTGDDPAIYHELYELFLRQHAYDKAWCAVNVLEGLRPLAEDQASFHAYYSPMPLSMVPGQLTPEAWRSHIMHAELDPALTAIFAIITPAMARLRQNHALGEPLGPHHSRMAGPVLEMVRNASEILGVAPPALYIGNVPNGLPFAPALAPHPALYVSLSAIDARPPESLCFVIGKRLAELRPELLARSFFPTVAELGGVLATAVRLTKGERAPDPATAQIEAGLGQVIMPQDFEQLRQIIFRATHEGAKFDVKLWSRLADVTSSRAGLLLAGHADIARREMLREPQSPTDLSPKEKTEALFRFAVSDEYADLRGAIGVAVQGDEAAQEPQGYPQDEGY